MGKTDATPTDAIMAKKKSEKTSKSRSEKAGLLMPVSKVNRHLRETRLSKRVGAGAPIYLAAVLEYAATEIMELAGQQLGKRKRITPMDIMAAIRNDEELNQLLSGAAVFCGDRVKDVTKAITISAPVAPKEVA